MPNYNFIQLDVFTDRAFAGNPLAVFPEAQGLTDEQMQQVAREMNLSETVFVLPSEKKDVLRRLRIFTPGSELPFAGHPIVGTWNCLAREGVVLLPKGGKGRVHLKHEVGIGVLPIEVDFQNGQPASVTMTQGKFEIRGEIDDPQEQADIARALGLAREDLDETLPIQAVSTGNTMLLVPVRSLAHLGNCRPDQNLLDDIFARSEVFRGGTGCYAFTRETIEAGKGRAHARFFVGMGIGEDPATGSAAGPLGGYLVHHDATRLEATDDGLYKFVIEQGDFINRPSRIGLEVKGSPGKVEEVRVSGTSVVVARGVLEF
ncbi:MAG: PhzF family phenazine biosynthesis protein [Pyrinomonadaceae bacterium]